jgi:hypothetical protein
MYARRYFEGQIELSRLRVVHYSLAAQSHQVTGRESERSSPPVAGPPVIRAKTSLEIALSQRGRDRAVSEREGHHAKAAAQTMLGDRFRELGMVERARRCEARASLEAASARGFDGVVKGYDKKLEDLGVREKAREASPTLQGGLDRLERAQRHLEAYNNSHAQAMGHVRNCGRLETEIQALEKQSGEDPQKSPGREKLEEAIYRRDLAASLAEKEALAAVRCYGEFQDETQAARRDYESLSLALTGKSLKSIGASPEKTDEGKPQPMSGVAVEKQNPQDGIAEPRETDPEVGKPDTKHTAATQQPYRRVAAGVVVAQVLRELEKGL